MTDVVYYTQRHPAAELNIIADCGFPVCYGEKGILELDITTKEPLRSVRALKAGLASNIMPDKAVMTLAGEASADVSDGRVSVERGGGATVLRATGVARHTAFPEGGVNALHELFGAALRTGLLCEEDERVLRFWYSIGEDWLGTALGIAHEDELSGHTTCVDSMASLLPDGRARLHLNIRYAITAGAEEMLASIRRACEEHGCALSAYSDSAPNYFPREHPVVDALTGVFREMSGLDREPFVMGGGTYARKLPNALCFGLGGLPHEPTDLFAPGHGGAHQCDEGLHLQSLKEAMKIFAMGLLEADRVL